MPFNGFDIRANARRVCGARTGAMIGAGIIVRMPVCPVFDRRRAASTEFASGVDMEPVRAVIRRSDVDGGQSHRASQPAMAELR